MTADPYAYPGSDVLINRENIRDFEELEKFERLITLQRISEGLPNAPLSAHGFRQLHYHIFQDVYDWAGCDRTVDIAKNNSYFCKAPFIARELEKRFDLIRGGNFETPDLFIGQAADHLSELNAIHPFREGNGRAMRAFLVILGRKAGYRIEIQRIAPEAWNAASRESYMTGDTGLMRDVVAGAIVST